MIEYVHDPLGRRMAKKIKGTVVEKYLWAGMTTLLAMYDGADNLVMRFDYADGRMPVSMVKDGVTYYLAYDQTGSLKAVADINGTVIKIIAYDSFGYITSDSNESFEVPFGFAGGLHDRDTGLVRFGFRDYDPQVGRWTAKDPILFGGGDSDLYGYVLNDPVNLIDPEGLQDKWYGFNDPSFRDYVHDMKQHANDGRKGGNNYTKKELKELWDQWNDEGRKGGKGCKSGKGGSSRGKGKKGNPAITTPQAYPETMKEIFDTIDGKN